MDEISFSYPALLIQQGPGAPSLALLSASTAEISQWVGIPQKTRLLDGETLGFQRDDDPARVEQIAQFYGEPRNVIHNPLLCAIRQSVGLEVSFSPMPSDNNLDPAIAGKLTIKLKRRTGVPLLEVFREAREALEDRVPELKGRSSPDALIAKLRAKSEIAFPPDALDQLRRASSSTRSESLAPSGVTASDSSASGTASLSARRRSVSPWRRRP